ncbi:MAG: hypothetical protein JKY66_04075 [Spongiibacteraceae bacterium]|nr:hypothetical protein [Spongiibacteraceae bacterium]
MNRHNLSKTFFNVSLLSVLCLNGAFADDTEVYLNQINLPPEQIRPNVVFILDTSGSMGLPVQSYGTSRYQELYQFDHNTSYTGSANTNGGAGDTNYYYLYRKVDTHADQYIYYNKIHTSQMTCDMSDLNDTTPYTDSRDRFIYDDGTTDWGHMCEENDSSCNFTPITSGALVDCKSEENHITDNDAYPDEDDSDNLLYAVSANFHNYLQSYYRYSVLQTVVKDLIDEPFDINMALMKFNGGSGGVVIKEAVDANLSSNQTDLKTVVNNLYADGTTPLTESLWEAARYLRGETATYGYISERATDAFTGSNSNTYNSPIDYACQKSHIILLTDGNPYNDGGRDSTIEDLTGNDCEHSNNANAADESCLDDYAGWLHTDDSSRRDHSSISGIQNITVHTIGFGLDNPLLNATATANLSGGEAGVSKTASTAAELSAAFSTILDQVEFEKDSYVAPAVAVNAYNGLQHRDELYFALFEPNASPRWHGNIKKYKFVGGVILDQNDEPAVDSSTGYFDVDALSYWTTSADLDTDGDGEADLNGDGVEVSIGGFARRLSDPDARNIYTYSDPASPSNETLSELLDNANTDITSTMLGVDGAADPAAERTAVLNWARGGLTATPPPNYFMADFIHNQPSVVTYTTTKTLDGNGEVTSVAFDDTIFAASNMGFFHAIDADDGTEIFSFVPKELYGNLTAYYQNSGGFTDKVYGLDAPMTVWRYDDNDDGSIVSTDNDHVYIYQSMRRGGTSTYALNVTDRNSPVLMWQIDGTNYLTSPTGDFRDLAQTWSVPQHGKIRWSCSGGSCNDREVLFFGGGYDTIHDTATGTTSDNKGSALFVVDAGTGELLWSAGNGAHHDLNLSQMDKSIPANVTIADIDSDGYIDLLFAVDIEGGLWRMDFSDETSNAANFARGGLIAQLGGSSGSEFRRFYNAPDVAYFTKRGYTPFLTISITSGWRSHPRDLTINDKLFVVFDKNALSPPENFEYRYVSGTSVITASNLPASGGNYGWSKAFTDSGEKGLSRTITFDDKIIFTTYIPNISSSCVGTTGGGRYYLLNALTGYSELKNSDDVVIPFKTLDHSGIPPEPAVIFSTGDICISNCDDEDESNDTTEERIKPMVCIGLQCFDGGNDGIEKTYWREN